jgi:hypothetical protein
MRPYIRRLGREPCSQRPNGMCAFPPNRSPDFDRSTGGTGFGKAGLTYDAIILYLFRSAWKDNRFAQAAFLKAAAALVTSNDCSEAIIAQAILAFLFAKATQALLYPFLR